MPFCEYCGTQLLPDASFCPNCGKPTGIPPQPPTATSDVNPGPPFGTVPRGTTGGMSSWSSLLRQNDIVMKKKILSLREHYDFEDTSGTKLGEGDGNFFQFPAKFVVLDTNGSELMHVEGKILSLRKQFTFYDNTGNQLGIIKKKLLKLIGEEYWVEQNGVEFMRIYGNFTEHDYRMEINKQEVAYVHKKWVAIRDSFDISISGNVDHRIVIGSVIVIEHNEVTEREHSNRGGGFGFRIG